MVQFGIQTGASNRPASGPAAEGPYVRRRESEGDLALAESLELLQHSRSAKRRSGAKQLRKLADPSAGPSLLAALQAEIQDPRTWETQYQLIMALAECGYREAIPFIRDLSKREFEATMVYVAIGDAIARLGSADESDASPALELLSSQNESLISGAMRAIAMRRLTLPDSQVSTILAFVSNLPIDHHLRFWPAAAAAAWSGPQVQAYLKECVESSRADTREAAVLSVEGKFKKWLPL